MARTTSRLSASTLVALTTQKALLAVAGVLTARLLGPADKGTLVVLVLTAAAGGLAATCGIDVWAARSRQATGPVAAVRGVVLRQAAVAVVVLGLGAAILSAATVPSNVLSGAEVLATVALAAVGAVFLLVMALSVNVERWSRWIAGHVVDGAAFFAGCAALVVMGVDSVVIVLVVAVGARALGAAVACRSLLGPVERAPGLHARALRVGVPAGLGGILLMATYRVDVFVLAALRPASEVGLYVTAAALSEALWLLPDAVSPIVLRRAGSPHGLDVGRICRLCVLAIAVGGALIVAMGEPLVRILFGDEFKGASAALPGLWIAAIVLGLWKVLVADLAAHGQTAIRVWSAGLAIVVMVGADLVLIPAWGIAGAAWGAALGYSAAAVGALVEERRRGQWSAADLVLPRPSDLSSLASLARGALGPGRMSR